MKRRLKFFTVAICALALAACGDKDLTGPTSGTNQVVFTRSTGSKVSVGKNIYAWCGEWEDGSVSEPSVHVIVADMTNLDESPFWLMSAVRKDITIGQPMNFPNEFIFDEPRGALVFMYDPPNEASTQEQGASGSITFDKIDCNTGGSIAFHIDAVLASEFSDGTPITAKGTFSSKITVNPRSLFGN